MTYKQALRKVRKNLNKGFDFKPYVTEPTWNIEDLIDYLNRCEKSEDGDYLLVLQDIEERINSCWFDADEQIEVINALGLADHFQFLTVKV